MEKENAELATGQGVFTAMLQRNNKQIRDDRAAAISDDAQLMYKRAIEDLEVEVKRIKRDRENMLDLSPANVQTLIIASDFKASEFAKKDLDLAVMIREKEIMLELARDRYKYLFGE